MFGCAAPVTVAAVPLTLPVTLPVIFPTKVPLMLSLASLNTDFAAGSVQNIVFVPALKFTALSLLELLITVVLASVEESLLNVPRPTSKSVIRSVTA